MFVSKTYDIQDCQYYNSTEVSRTTTQGSTIYDNNMSVALPSKCEISMDIHSFASSNHGEHRYFILPKSQYSSGTTQPQYALFSDIRTEQRIPTFGKRENNSSITFGTYSTITNDYHTFKWVIDGTTVEMYIDDDLKTTQTISWIGNYSDYCISMMRWSGQGTSKIKNVKIKPL